MIPKVIHGSDPQGLRDYLVEQRDHEVLSLVDVSDIGMAAEEMEAVARLSPRVRSPVLHISVSAAIEDGTISKERWLALVERIEHEFQLAGHQRVVVRHRDKAYDHIHIFWCTVSLGTFMTPPKRPFLNKGPLRAARGYYPLTNDEAKSLPREAVVKRSFDSFALYRLQDLCRRVEREWELRRVRTHGEVAEARAKGESRPPKHWQKQRQARLGADPLINLGDGLRTALDAPNWPEALDRLRRLGVTLQPVFRKSKAGRGKLVGLCLYEVADPGNKIKASELDLPGRRYGLRQIESRHEPGALPMDDWWDEGMSVSVPLFKTDIAPDSPHARCRRAYDLFREAVRCGRAEKMRLRQALKKKHKQEVRYFRRAMMARRKEEAAALDPSERRAFYTRFSREVRKPALAKLEAEHRAAVARLRPGRLLTWSEFLDDRAKNGDPDARQVLSPVRAPRPAGGAPNVNQEHTHRGPGRLQEEEPPAPAPQALDAPQPDGVSNSADDNQILHALAKLKGARKTR